MNFKKARLFVHVFSVLIFINAVLLKAQNTDNKLTLFSPDKAIKVEISLKDELSYMVNFDGGQILAPSSLSMEFQNEGTLGKNPRLQSSDRRSVNETVTPVVKEKFKSIQNQFNELRLNFRGNYSVLFRAYNGGVAYRFITNLGDKKVKVVDENVNFNFTDNHNVFFPEENSFFTHSERHYKYLPLNEIGPNRQSVLPAVVDINRGPKIAITEADLVSYPGLYLRGKEKPGFKGAFPYYVTKVEQPTDRDVRPVARADYMAETEGNRSFPWRVLLIEERDTELIENQLVYLLSTPLKIKDPSWIKPGMVAWDWYNALNLYDVDFKAGVNNETYKYYIDFAAKYNLDYVILDEGWYELGDLTAVNPDIDVPELVEYGKTKGVDIILWVVWKTLEEQWEVAFDQFEQWGIKGIKVDFMQRDDQWMVDYYWRVAEEAAKRKMLVNFHGSYSPKGIRRTYPNVITREGVKGLENNKWSYEVTPEHNVTLPYTRMLAGPMDYTPGAMVNAQKQNFRPIFNRPMSMSTRCHQLAMYVVYESPLQMLADSPSHYLKDEQTMNYLSQVPTVWDETRVLSGQIGEYILIARRNRENWYVGAMTDGNSRKIHLNFSFLGEGNYRASIYRDGINAARYGSDYEYIEQNVNAKSSINLELAPGGGWAAIIKPEE